MNKPDPKQVAALLRKPQGDEGIKVGEEMNKSNNVMYDLVFSTLEFSDEENILEIGFGNGNFFSSYLEFNPSLKLFGLDYSELMCEEAIRRNPDLVKKGKLKVKHGDAASTGFPDSTFDKVVALNTVYFWDPLDKYFLEINRILKRGGLFSMGFRPKHVIRDFEFVKYDFNLYEAEDLKEIARECGFEFAVEKQIEYEKKSVSGHVYQAKDICLTFKKGRV